MKRNCATAGGHVLSMTAGWVLAAMLLACLPIPAAMAQPSGDGGACVRSDSAQGGWRTKLITEYQQELIAKRKTTDYAGALRVIQDIKATNLCDLPASLDLAEAEARLGLGDTCAAYALVERYFQHAVPGQEGYKEAQQMRGHTRNMAADMACPGAGGPATTLSGPTTTLPGPADEPRVPDSLDAQVAELGANAGAAPGLPFAEGPAACRIGPDQEEKAALLLREMGYLDGGSGVASPAYRQAVAKFQMERGQGGPVTGTLTCGDLRRLTATEPQANECDFLAADPAGPGRPEWAAGVYLNEIDASKAIPACRQALQSYPRSERLKMQLARALLAGGDYDGARELFEASAANGDPRALYGRGLMSLNGWGVPKDGLAARERFERADGAGYAPASAALGDLYAGGISVPRDRSKARDYYIKASAAGSLYGELGLGLLGSEPDATPAELADARDRLQVAAKAGMPAAEARLGQLHDQGRGVPRDDVEAASWYRRAADHGDAASQARLGDLYRLGEGVQQDYSTAVRWYARAADAGEPAGITGLGWAYETGLGAELNLSEAVSHYTRAAKAGYAPAQHKLGRLYASSKFPEEKLTDAVAWLQRAADQQYAPAFADLGALYYEGEGVKRDRDLAYTMFQTAAGAEDALGLYWVGFMYDEGKGVKSDETKAAEYYRRAGELGNPDAQFAMGLAYEKGRGVKKDKSEAGRWYAMAAAQGKSEAAERLEKLR